MCPGPWLEQSGRTVIAFGIWAVQQLSGRFILIKADNHYYSTDVTVASELGMLGAEETRCNPELAFRILFDLISLQIPVK